MSEFCRICGWHEETHRQRPRQTCGNFNPHPLKFLRITDKPVTRPDRAGGRSQYIVDDSEHWIWLRQEISESWDEGWVVAIRLMPESAAPARVVIAEVRIFPWDPPGMFAKDGEGWSLDSGAIPKGGITSSLRDELFQAGAWRRVVKELLAEMPEEDRGGFEPEQIWSGRPPREVVNAVRAYWFAELHRINDPQWRVTAAAEVYRVNYPYEPITANQRSYMGTIRYRLKQNEFLDSDYQPTSRTINILRGHDLLDENEKLTGPWKEAVRGSEPIYDKGGK